MAQERDTQKQKKAEQLAAQIWSLARDRLLVNLRFLDASLAALTLQARWGLEGITCNGRVIFYDPAYVLYTYKREPNLILRAYLHILLHCIFNHAYRYEKVTQEWWDAAVDMAVENVVLDMKLPDMDTGRDKERRQVLEQWRARIGTLTAERIYRQLQKEPMEHEDLSSLAHLFARDSHTAWEQDEMPELSMQQWKKLSERIKAELKAFSEDKNDKNSIVQNLEEATREHYDYGDFLRKFCVSGEEMQINDDEFDYVYYTYGLSLYGNMPLIEPLEYKDVNKIREFVVAIDTSASCRGSLVQAFLHKTYDILKSSENFFRKVNIHILQCDSEVRRDTKVTGDDEFEAFMREGSLEGFGSTDFRPVFTYVNGMLERGEFENLKGLIYFTDGYGVFPEQMPPYDTAFVFLDDDYGQPPIPPWAIKLVLSGEDIEEATQQ